MLLYTPSMRLSEAARVAPTRLILPLLCAVLVAACSTSPTSGRTQFNILPDTLETTVPDLRFEVKTLITAGGGYCREEADPCPAKEAAEKLAQRIAPIAERLGSKTAELSPEMTQRVPQVEVFVVPGDSPSVSSSAGGRIAVGAGLARIPLSEADLAFALAREFGRLAAAHHRESTSAGLAVSLIAGSPLTSAYLATSLLADIIFPMGALAKVGISLLASMGTEQLVEASQQDEADEFAVKLMLAAGYDPKALAEPRPDAPQGAVLIGWLSSYFASRAKVAERMRPDPWPDEALTAVARADPPEPWPDEAQPTVAKPAEPWPDEAPATVAVAAEPWPDDAQEPSAPTAAPPQAQANGVGPLAKAAPAGGEMRNAPDAPPKAAAAKVQGKKNTVKKTKKQKRKVQKRSKPR